MTQIQGTQKNKLIEFLKTVTAYSVIDSGMELAASGGISEASKTGSRIRGIARDTDETVHTAELDILSPNDIGAACTCCAAEEMQEQWCRHVVALLWSAFELGFLETTSGFASSESLIRMNVSSPEEIAGVIRDVGHLEYAPSPVNSWLPNVEIFLETSSDRLGVQVRFDGEGQTPAVFEGFRKISARALDNILLKVLEEEGSWDDTTELWYVNSSEGIEVVLGIIQEYPKILSASDRKPIVFSKELLDAHLEIKWRETAAEISMYWVLPDGKHRAKDSELLGTGPFWACLDHTLYRISPPAARVCSVFPYGSSLTLPRSQVGPILEAIHSGIFNQSIIKIQNEELQPESEVKTPLPLLTLSVRDNKTEHFVSSQRLEIEAVLSFDYPTPPKNRNVVYIPDREQERSHVDYLKSLGFEQTLDRKKFTVSGDAALDLAAGGTSLFEAPWKVAGFETVKEQIKFAKLSVNVSISSAEDTKTKSKSAEWFDCHISLIQNNSNIPISTLFKSARSMNEKWIRLDSGAYARVPGGSLNYLKTTFGLLDPNFKLSNTIKAKLRTAQAVNLARIEDSSFELSLDKRLRELETKLREFKSIEPLPVSPQFKGKLRPYQHEGLNWLGFLHDFELGGILADEMGLGKTVQTLAFLQHLKDQAKKGKKKSGPVLIVAPTSVITNWFYEIKRFTPALSVLLLHGPARKGLFQEIPNSDLVITSYALLRLDRAELERHEFDYFVLDEAQNIKNPQAAISKAAKAMRAKRRIALTGTPTENRPLELWSIIDFVMPGYLGSEEFFRSYIEKPILENISGAQVVKFLNGKTRPFILRRAKAEVEKDLPPKIQSVMHVEMSASQSQLYAQVLEEVRPKVFEAIQKKGIGGASVSILAALLRLRQICNHPNSIDALKELPGYESGKFNLLKELVEEALQNGRKILLFSQFREMLNIIRMWLEEQKVNYLYLDGTTRNRQELIDQFNNDSEVRLFLISLKAGGTGLNLTAADTVVIYDPWWNPAVEDQAVDRAHRIGQTKAVSVYRLVTENSVEQKIMDLKAKKAKVVEALINENGLSTLKLSKTDIETLFEPMPELK